MKVKKGACRAVLLTAKYAFKFPRFNSWQGFLWGLLSNRQEAVFSKTKDPRLCPVLFCLPLGFLVVMPRLLEMTQEEFNILGEEKLEAFINQDEMIVPAELKASSFGWMDGDQLMAMYYGGPYWWEREGNKLTIWMDGTNQAVALAKDS